MKDTSEPMFPQPATYVESAREAGRIFNPEMKISGISYRQWLAGLAMKEMIGQLATKQGQEAIKACSEQAHIEPGPNLISTIAHRYADSMIAFQQNENA